MTTKQEERNALAKIRKIVESLGEDSYLAMAFDGAFDIAESNIENDFADSTRDYMEKAGKAREWFDEATSAKLRVGDLEQELDKRTDELNKRTEERDVSMEMCEEAQQDYERLYKEREELIEKLGQRTQQAVDAAVEMLAHQKEAQELGEQLREAREEIKELKAKLYDYIVNDG